MSKVSTTESSNYPTYSNGTISINGTPKASTSYSNGSVNSNYYMNDNEKSIYDYAQSTLASILPQLNVFSEDTKKSIQTQLNAYKESGIDTINDIYTPMIKNLKNDIASRFGNLDNSIFMDSLSGIESKRGDAVNALSQDLLEKQSNLEAAELQKRYNFADFLNGMQNQTYDNMLSAINTALGNSSSANSYNNNLYNALYKQYLQNQSSTSNLSSLFSSALGITGGSSFL